MMENKDGLCELEVKKNLVLAEIGKPLTLPLATLNRSCEFRKEWDRIQNIWHGSNTPEEINNAKRRIYCEKPEVKAKIKAYCKVYNQNPENKAKIKAYKKIYRQKPENKIKMKAYLKKWYKNKKRILNETNMD